MQRTCRALRLDTDACLELTTWLCLCPHHVVGPCYHRPTGYPSMTDLNDASHILVFHPLPRFNDTEDFRVVCPSQSLDIRLSICHGTQSAVSAEHITKRSRYIACMLAVQGKQGVKEAAALKGWERAIRPRCSAPYRRHVWHQEIQSV